MNKKNKSKLALNILSLFHLENTLKKKTTIPIPINKIKSSISSLLFLKQKNSNNKNHRLKNLNNTKNMFHTNKTKNLYSTKSTEFIKYIPKSNKKKFSTKKKMKKNFSKINNINQININNNINIINHLDSNPFDYLINSSNSIKQKRNSYSAKDQKKEKYKDKEKEINCLKLNSNNNTNSTSINTNNTNKNCKIKNGCNSNISNSIEEMQMNNQKLKTKIDEISLENKNLNKKIKQLRNKNLDLRKVLYVIKKERDDYSQSINQSLKLLKTLKENGLELSQIIENLSSSDNEENEDDEEDVCDIKNIKNIKNFGNNILKLNEKEKNMEIEKDLDKEESELSNVSFGRVDFHEEYNAKKIPIGIKCIPKLKIYDIKNENI